MSNAISPHKNDSFFHGIHLSRLHRTLQIGIEKETRECVSFDSI